MSSRVPVTGGYGCVDLPGAEGWAIRHFTRSDFSHAFMILDAQAGTILAAHRTGASISNLSEYHGLELVYSTDACTSDRRALITLTASYLGIPYGFLDIAYLGLELTDLWTPGWMLDAVLDERRMICSQLVASFGAACGHDWKCGQQYDQLVTPGMLAARA